MMRRLLMSFLLCPIFLLLAPGAVPADQIYFDVTFDDQPVDQPLGTGGAAMGQASWINEGLVLTVRSTPFTSPCLEVRTQTRHELGRDQAALRALRVFPRPRDAGSQGKRNGARR